MLDYTIDAEQLRKALAEIERAEKNGFMYCLAVFRMSITGDSITEWRGNYTDLVEAAHPTDGRFRWGRGQDITKRYRWKNGKLIPIRRKG